MRAMLLLLVPLLHACAPEIGARVRCTDDSECFLGERCVASECTSVSGDTGVVGDTANFDADAQTSPPDGATDALTDVAQPEDTGSAPDVEAPDATAADAPAPDAGAPDSGAPDSGAPDAGAPDAPDAGPDDEVEIVISVVLSSLDATTGGHVDVGFCPDPAKNTGSGPLLGVPACDDGVFLRFTKATASSVQALGMQTSNGEVTAKSQPIAPSASSPISITLRSTAKLQQPTAKVDVELTASAGGLKLDWTGQTESRYLARFGAWNLSTAVPCLAAKSFEATLSEVSVKVDGKPVALQTLRANNVSKKGTWTPGVSWIDFVVDACTEQYFLLQIGPQ